MVDSYTSFQRDFSASKKLLFEDNDVEVDIIAPVQFSFHNDDMSALSEIIEDVEADVLSKPHKDNIYERLFVIIVDNCIDQLSVLVSVVPQHYDNGKNSEKELSYRSSSERFGFNVVQKYGETIIGETFTDEDKMVKEMRQIINLLDTIKCDFSLFHRPLVLEEFIRNYDKMREDDALVKIGLAHKLEMFDLLTKAVASYKTESIKHFQTVDNHLKDIVVKTKDLMEHSSATISYVKRWETARNEQNSIILRSKEDMFMTTVRRMEIQMNDEDKCHSKIKEYLNEVQKDQASEMDRWMEAYNREYDEMDMKIYQIKRDTEKLVEKRNKLEEEYERRTRAMEDWKEYKKLKRQREAREIREYFAAKRIQAWWRAIMQIKKLEAIRRAKKAKKETNGKAKRKKK